MEDGGERSRSPFVPCPSVLCPMSYRPMSHVLSPYFPSPIALCPMSYVLSSNVLIVVEDGGQSRSSIRYGTRRMRPMSGTDSVCCYDIAYAATNVYSEIKCRMSQSQYNLYQQRGLLYLIPASRCPGDDESDAVLPKKVPVKGGALGVSFGGTKPSMILRHAPYHPTLWLGDVRYVDVRY
eukprot:1600804-Rhodomonas_salina.4